ncbi:4-(cytidine 5'-diphospho)-2-C-methyl-D-erythritol kinase [Microbacterium sp.]|uniref:4-(cytidine 5'-diphospho)-2-C-methyl-D-erythritol kinase n=1 Tax=Microbacterium sp. TaxID=51671 RepID=UPI0039E6CB00
MNAGVAPRRVHVRAPGKLNVFFEVGAAGADGYHDVASVYQAVSLYEDVVATPADGFTISVHGEVDTTGVPQDDRNLAIRAARLVALELGHEGGVHLEVHKGVPVAGGMGGGSADAAAALVACDALWRGGLSHARLHALAARLGADVPFALLGGTAVGTGRGDVLTPALAGGRFEWVLVTSDEGLSTPEVYRELDRLRATGRALAPTDEPVVDPAVLQALRAGAPAALAVALRNDLQTAARSLRPDLAALLALGGSQGALGGIVSGSGPTVAFLGGGSGAAAELRELFTASGLAAFHVHGPVPGARIVSD